jgi:excinuclease UvrABC helicase subunit UvrB
VSCIYGLGSPRRTTACCCRSSAGQRIERDRSSASSSRSSTSATIIEFGRGTFRVRGDIVEVYPSYEEHGLRIELFGDEVDELASFDPLTGKTLRRHDKIAVLSQVALRRAARAHQEAPSSDQGGAGLVSGRSSRRKASCSRRSGCISARCSISR